MNTVKPLVGIAGHIKESRDDKGDKEIKSTLKSLFAIPHNSWKDIFEELDFARKVLQRLNLPETNEILLEMLVKSRVVIERLNKAERGFSNGG